MYALGNEEREACTQFVFSYSTEACLCGERESGKWKTNEKIDLTLNLIFTKSYSDAATVNPKLTLVTFYRI